MLESDVLRMANPSSERCNDDGLTEVASFNATPGVSRRIASNSALSAFMRSTGSGVTVDGGELRSRSSWDAMWIPECASPPGPNEWQKKLAD